MFPSWDRSWYDTYESDLKLLPKEKNVNFDDMMKIIESKKEGTKARKDCVNACKKLAELSEHSTVWDKLNKLDTRIIKRKKDEKPLQSISLEDFLDLRKAVWEHGVNDKQCHPYLESRKRWLWVFSMQAVYGFRISEVFAIQNIDKPFKTPDGVTIPALNDPKNVDMIAVVEETVIGTTVKTGYRLARPFIPPKHPNLIEELELRDGKLPDNRPREDSKSKSKANFFCSKARNRLSDWQKQIKSLLGDKNELTQTHALRHLANLNGMMAGVSLEQRAMSLGHSPAMNDSTYKKRRTTQTTLDVLTTQTQSIPLEGAIGAYKAIYGDAVDENAIKLLAAIYGVTPEKVKNALGIEL